LQLAIKSERFDIVEDQKILIEKSAGKRIKLFGKNDNLNYPSCELLDVCLYQEKLLLADVTITLLPIRYKTQQEKVKKLFSLLHEDPSIIVIYFSTEGNIAEIDHWSNKTKSLKDVLNNYN